MAMPSEPVLLKRSASPLDVGAKKASTLVRPVARAVLVFVLAVIIIALRRWPQVMSPDVWVEDGTQVLPSFVAYGWAGLFAPVSGYLIVPAKLVSYAALTVSFVHYAAVSTALAVAVQAAVVAAIAVAPTSIPARPLAALLVVCLPVGSEVYALPVYTIWWTTLLLFPGLLWRTHGQLILRVAAIVIGGLSSPFIVVSAPAFVLRAGLERCRSNTVAAATAVLAAAIQGGMMLRERASNVPLTAAMRHLDVLVSKYFGTALYSLGQHGAGAFGVLVAVCLTGFLFVLPRASRLPYLLLGLSLGAAILTSVSRVPVEAPHPLLAGPRYFFFPLILTGWMLLLVCRDAGRSTVVLAALIGGSYIPSFAADLAFEPQEPKLPWETQARACMAAPGNYTFDIQTGLPYVHWIETLPGDACRSLDQAALF